jgi:hypothetical protein
MKFSRKSLNLIFFTSTEADVHTATPTIGNAAATWAGWAVSAVSAKFYRSQSDTRPRPPLTGKNLSKPASLGMFSRLVSYRSPCNLNSILFNSSSFHFDGDIEIAKC